MSKSLTQEHLKVLRILSNGSDLAFQRILQSSPKHIDMIIASYYKRKPVIDDLNNHGIKINDLEDLINPDFKEELFEKAASLLVDWLKKESSYDVRAMIVHVLINRPVSKKFAFDTIIDLYKSIDPNYIDEWGAKTDLPIFLGNAFVRWTDDEHAESILSLLNDKNFREDNFLLSSVANFKKPENVKKAIKLLMQELQKPNLPNARLGTIISSLRKLKAVEARELIYPFTNFPNNYKRTIEIDPKKYGYVTDSEVRAEAKKTIDKFDKLRNQR